MRQLQALQRLGTGGRGLFQHAGACCENALPPSRSWVERDLVAEALEASDEATFHRLLVAFVEVAVAKIVIDLTLTEHVVSDHQDGVANSDRGPLRAPSRGEAVIVRRQIRPLAAPRGSGRLDERRAQPR